MYIHTFCCEVYCSLLTVHNRVTQSKPHNLDLVICVIHQGDDSELCCIWSSHNTLHIPHVGDPHRVPGDVVKEGEIVEAGSFVGVVPQYCDSSTINHRISDFGWHNSV